MAGRNFGLAANVSAAVGWGEVTWDEVEVRWDEMGWDNVRPHCLCRRRVRQADTDEEALHPSLCIEPTCRWGFPCQTNQGLPDPRYVLHPSLLLPEHTDTSQYYDWPYCLRSKLLEHTDTHTHTSHHNKTAGRTAHAANCWYCIYFGWCFIFLTCRGDKIHKII